MSSVIYLGAVSQGCEGLYKVVLSPFGGSFGPIRLLFFPAGSFFLFVFANLYNVDIWSAQKVVF